MNTGEILSNSRKNFSVVLGSDRRSEFNRGQNW